MSTKRFVDPVAILAAAELLLTVANADVCCKKTAPRTIRKKSPCGCGGFTQPRDEFGRFTRQSTNPCRPAGPLPRWGVVGYPPEDKNKVFGAGFEIDEPIANAYRHRWQYESDKEAFDRFVDAGEDCIARGMGKKSNAPITKVNAVRRRIFDGPPIGLNLVGETQNL